MSKFSSDFPLPLVRRSLGEGGLREGARGRGNPQPKSISILRSRELRAQATKAEVVVWQKLRRKSFYGLRFRRQFPIGPYFGDFVCLPARLVVELDGAQHADSLTARYDQRRTEWLASQDFRVLRFWNGEVFNDVDRVLEVIDSELLAGPLPLTPSRKGRGKSRRDA